MISTLSEKNCTEPPNSGKAIVVAFIRLPRKSMSCKLPNCGFYGLCEYTLAIASYLLYGASQN